MVNHFFVIWLLAVVCYWLRYIFPRSKPIEEVQANENIKEVKRIINNTTKVT